MTNLIARPIKLESSLMPGKVMIIYGPLIGMG